jgi:hypothetical protein
MTPKHWTKNLTNSIGTIPNHQIIQTIFSSILDLTIMNDWKGACHESCAAIHILLNETGVQNTWCIGEAKVGEAFFNHSWIEINSEIYDISICKPLQPAFKSGPVIKDIDIDTNQQTTTLYGEVSGHPDDPMTIVVKSFNLSDYLANSPIHPTLGTWLLIDQVAKYKLKQALNISSLMTKYQGKYFTTRP